MNELEEEIINWLKKNYSADLDSEGDFVLDMCTFLGEPDITNKSLQQKLRRQLNKMVDKGFLKKGWLEGVNVYKLINEVQYV